jgi:subtilase family serine protease
MRSKSPILKFSFILMCVLFGSKTKAQETPSARITQAIDDTNLIVLHGNTHPNVRTKLDRGAAPSSLALNRMLLVLKRSSQQESSLKSLLDQQQQKSSGNYHRWLTPEQFGQQFGASDQDVHTITSWLSSHGFHIDSVGKNQLIIEFSGTAGQVKEAFHTEIREYEVDGKQYWANSADPAIPSALSPVVAGIASLHNFGRKPMHRVANGAFSHLSNDHRLEPSSQGNPLFTGGGGCGLNGTSCYVVAPYDFAKIYNVLPLWNASPPINGTGQTIAIVSQSNIYPQDFSDFRANFGLPQGTLNIIYNGPNPGWLPTEGDELESDLDVQTAGAVATKAVIDLVVSATTNTTAGVDLSALYIVDNNLAPVLSDSYGNCEFEMGTTGNQFYNQLWQQAAAEGITVFVAAGDSGSATCDRFQPIATQGLSVNGIASTPYDIAVGGTDFNDLQNPSTYWSSTNNSRTEASALSYIPEMSWNDTCTNTEFFSFTGETTAESDCNDANSIYYPTFTGPVAGGGGASNCISPTGDSVSSCTGGYSKPAWQTGNGVPNDGARDIPDVSLFAADGLNASMYGVCELDMSGGCYENAYNIILVGGTSAAAPAFAGIMALVNQQTQSRQGLANYVFYPLAAQGGASCDSSGMIGSGCIFYDVTAGTIAMPCTTGTPDCSTNTNGDLDGVLSGFSTTSGFDLATGLGSVNVANLVNNWSSVSFQPTTSSLSLNPTTQITHGTAVNVNVGVTPQTGTGTPTGQVSLLTSSGPVAGTFTLADGSVSTTTTLLPGGTYTVTAHYAGDGTYGASDSSPGIAVTVNPEGSTATLEAFTLDSNFNEVPYTTAPYGVSTIYLHTNVTGQSGQGIPTGSVNLTQTLNGITTNLPGNPYPLNSEGYTMTPLPGYYYLAFTPGNYSFSAKYSGDSSFASSTSVPISFTVTQAQTSTSLSILNCIGQCVYNPGEPLNLFATITDNNAPPPNSFVTSNPPSGTVTFYSNGIALGPATFVDTGVSPPVAGITVTQLPLGPDNITAQYSGDTNYFGSTSSAMLVATGETFSMAASPSVINIAAPGQSGSTTLTLTAQNSFTGSAMLSPSMCSFLPPQSSCSFSPTSVNFTSSTTSVPVTLTIATSAAGSALPGNRRFTPTLPEISTILVGCAVAVTIALFGFWKPSRRVIAPVVFGLFLIAVAISCGGGSMGGNGGSGNNGGGGIGSGGTPAGNYQGVTVSITINNVTQTIDNLSVNVQ